MSSHVNAHADDLAGFDFNKANSPLDVSCVYNFDSAAARDEFAGEFEALWLEASGNELASDACVGEFWAYKAGATDADAGAVTNLSSA